MTRVVPIARGGARFGRHLVDDSRGQSSRRDRVVRAIGARIDQLAHHPRLGPRRPDIQPRARVLVEGPYLILFETHPDTDDGPVDWVEIVRVVDGRRDLARVI